MARAPRMTTGEGAGRRGALPLAAILGDPRARAAGIPLVLWVCAAVVAHLAGGGGAMEAAKIAEERAELRAAVRAERAGLRPVNTEIELLTDNAEPFPQQVEPLKDDLPGEVKNDGEPDPEGLKPDALPKPPPPKPEAKPEPPKVEPPKPEPPKPEPPKPPPPPLKPLAPKEAPPAQPAPPPPPPPPPMEADHRIAVRQHVKPDQEDNAAANRIADEANHVDKETMAKARAQDMDSPKPTMGSAKPGGPKDEAGNDKDARSGSGEEHKGDKDHAPGESKAASSDSEHEAPRPPVPPTPKAGPPPSVPASQGKGAAGAAQPAGPPPSPGGAGPASPEVTAGDKGSYTLNPADPGGDGKTRLPGRKRPPNAFQSPVHVGALGLGGQGLPGGPQINLNMAGVEAAVGNEQLKRERAADGAARLAHHRGQGPKNKFDKFRPAIENYEPSVELGNTTALNAARVPFATYLNTIHNRLHPIFAEEYLEFYNSRPKTEKVNDFSIFTSLEIVLDKTTGKIVRMGVTKTSGITEYDLTALASVDRAGPFGKAPDVIASPDGNVYLHWEFHRDPVDACTTRNARPFILKDAPKKAAGPVGPLRKPAKTSDDRTAPSGPLVPIRP
jgi:hypothetical protein